MANRPLTSLLSILTLIKLLAEEDELLGLASKRDTLGDVGSFRQKVEFLSVKADLEAHHNLVEAILHQKNEEEIAACAQEWAFSLFICDTRLTRNFRSPTRKELETVAEKMLRQKLADWTSDLTAIEPLVACAIATCAGHQLSLYTIARRWRKNGAAPDMEAVTAAWLGLANPFPQRGEM